MCIRDRLEPVGVPFEFRSLLFRPAAPYLEHGCVEPLEDGILTQRGPPVTGSDGDSPPLDVPLAFAQIVILMTETTNRRWRRLPARGPIRCGSRERRHVVSLSLIHISEPTRLLSISYAVFCLKKK